MADFNDIRDFFTAVCTHECDKRHIVSKDCQGNTIYNTFIGYECEGCLESFRCPLSSVKAVQKPLRPYVVNVADRKVVAERANADSKALLLELRNSGGWAQPDPGVTLLTAMAAALGPPGNPMKERLAAAMKGEKPS